MKGFFFPSKLFMDITGSTCEIAKGVVVFRCKGEQEDVIASRHKDVEDMALVNLDVVIESAYIVKQILIAFVVIQNSLKVSKGTHRLP